MQAATDKHKTNRFIDAGSRIAEIYRSLRLNLEFAHTGKQLRTIAVTSANPGEGKTTTVMNLAATFAIQEDKKVLLIDADLRNPSVHVALPGDQRPGLSDFLTGESSLPDIVKPSPIANLAVITAGSTPPNPFELLATERMERLLSEVREQYDIIFIDTPPVLGLSDARVVAAKCDGVVLVVEYGKVKRHAAKKLKDELLQVNANLLGIVLNKIDEREVKEYLYAGHS